jgi:hypothetical protein
LEYALAIAVGVALAACSGLRAFLPLLAAGVLARTGHFPLAEKLDWLQSTPALVALSVAALVELFADKVPALDHALDVASTPLRTVAGAIVAVAALGHCFPSWAAVLLGTVAGASTALSVHATKATVRAGSTLTTAGAANPVLSLIEDAACAVVSFLAPVFAVIAILVATAALVFLFFAGRALLRRLRRRPAATVSASTSEVAS